MGATKERLGQQPDEPLAEETEDRLAEAVEE